MVVTAPPPLQDCDQAVEDGVIDDARDRQRRHRRVGSALAAAALAMGALVLGVVGGGGGSGVSQLTRGHGSKATPGTRPASRAAALATPWPWVAEFGLLAPRVGWVAAGSDLYLTRSGGRSWASLPLSKLGAANAELIGSSSGSPEQLAVSFAASGQGSLTQPNRASARGSSRSPLGQVVLTANAGRTWRSRAFAPRASPGALSFLTRRLGFALAYAPAAHHDPRASLYETHDGARTWTRIARVPFQGLLSFANPRDGLGGGWALGAGLVDGAAIYRTGNGGRSWKRTSLCGPAAACEAPRLFGSGRGVVLMTASDQRTGRTRVEVYTTRDNGVTWTRHILPQTPTLAAGPTYIPFSAPDANDLFAWVSPYLYASHDGGITWSRHVERALTAGAPPSSVGDIAFASRSYGWYADGPVFAYTTDAGGHWTKFKHAG